MKIKNRLWRYLKPTVQINQYLILDTSDTGKWQASVIFLNKTKKVVCRPTKRYLDWFRCPSWLNVHHQFFFLCPFLVNLLWGLKVAHVLKCYSSPGCNHITHKFPLFHFGNSRRILFSFASISRWLDNVLFPYLLKKRSYFSILSPPVLREAQKQPPESWHFFASQLECGHLIDMWKVTGQRCVHAVVRSSVRAAPLGL